MDHLFSPWRYDYVSQEKQDGGCVFCRLAEADAEQDETTFIVHRARHHFLVLNIYPYNPGHLLIVPYQHCAKLSELPDPGLVELARLAARVEALLDEVYRPEGVNLGLNLGRCAGAGIADHLHLHAVPRWAADTNFITVTGRTRVIPEGIDESWRKLHGKLGEQA